MAEDGDVSFGQQQELENGLSWGTIALIAVGGIVIGSVLIGGLSEADKCPRLHTTYKKWLASQGEEHKLTDFILDEAKQANCRWAHRFPFTEE